MFISDELIFLQLQKTAGTHIAALLGAHLGGRMKGKHGPLDFDPGDRLVVGSVRNPWDWYVSLWSYGCGAAGGGQGLLKGSKTSTARRITGAAWRQPALWSGALRGERINASKRGKAESYYDDATRALVAQSDPFMVEHFYYTPPFGAGA